MKHIKNIDNFISEKFNPRLSKNKKFYPYLIHVKYEHGDADLYTNETFKFSNEEDFKNVLKFFHECMNFVPNTGYENLGYFQPIPDQANNGESTEEKVREKLCDIGEKYNLSDGDVYDYIKSDAHYHGGFASIEGIKITINGQNKVLVFKDNLETNKIVLPKIGDIIKTNANEVNGYGKDLFGGEYTDYMPNSGPKDYLIPNFEAKVLDCSINFHHDYENEYYTSYTSFHYVLLLESTKNVLKDNISHYHGKKPLKLTTEISGYDPEFESKFNKKKYDDLNYYEI